MYVRGFSSWSISWPYFFSFEVVVAYPRGFPQCFNLFQPDFLSRVGCVRCHHFFRS